MARRSSPWVLLSALASVVALPACPALTEPPSPEPIATETTTAASAPPPEAPPRPAPPAPPSMTAAASAAAPAPGPAGSEKLVIQDETPGSGPAAKTGDHLSVQYTGTLVDGKEFDSSRRPGRKPFDLTLGGSGVPTSPSVIDGWTQGLTGMKAGGKRKVTIPPSLAYGARGRPPIIPPNATLVFELELVSIKP
jgi:FKBP-type peptidyl-prolyl cis-trans isomerase FkpA